MKINVEASFTNAEGITGSRCSFVWTKQMWRIHAKLFDIIILVLEDFHFEIQFKNNLHQVDPWSDSLKLPQYKRTNITYEPLATGRPTRHAHTWNFHFKGELHTAPTRDIKGKFVLCYTIRFGTHRQHGGSTWKHKHLGIQFTVYIITIRLINY